MTLTRYIIKQFPVGWLIDTALITGSLNRCYDSRMSDLNQRTAVSRSLLTEA